MRSRGYLAGLSTLLLAAVVLAGGCGQGFESLAKQLGQAGDEPSIRSGLEAIDKEGDSGEAVRAGLCSLVSPGINEDRPITSDDVVQASSTAAQEAGLGISINILQEKVDQLSAAGVLAQEQNPVFAGRYLQACGTFSFPGS